MKKIILSAVMVLALAGGSVFASTAQNSNTSGSKSAGMKSGKKRMKKHHKRAKTSTMKKGNSNSK